VRQVLQSSICCHQILLAITNVAVNADLARRTGRKMIAGAIPRKA